MTKQFPQPSPQEMHVTAKIINTGEKIPNNELMKARLTKNPCKIG